MLFCFHFLPVSQREAFTRTQLPPCLLWGPPTQLSCKPKDSVSGLISEISYPWSSFRSLPRRNRDTREHVVQLAPGSKMHRVPKPPTMALRGKDTSQQSLCYKVISVPTREGKSLLNLHTAYSVRLPLTQSEQKRSETRVTAECKYTNFYTLAKNL